MSVSLGERGSLYPREYNFIIQIKAGKIIEEIIPILTATISELTESGYLTINFNLPIDISNIIKESSENNI